MSASAGIIVTGTEVLSGRIQDQNGPWLSRQLLELGVCVEHLLICGDRPGDLTAQLHFLTRCGVDLIITTGGLGPTADDLTVATVARFCGREVAVDPGLRALVGSIIRRWRHLPEADALPAALAAAVDKQSVLPAGAEAIAPAGTAPGIVIPAHDGVPTVLILPGPPRELREMWPAALATGAVTEALAGRDDYRHATIRAYGLSEADLAVTLAGAEESIAGVGDLEVTTCMRLGELDIDTRYPAGAAAAYGELAELLRRCHGDQIFTTDGSSFDDVLAAALAGRTIATAESCTGGMIAARLTDRAGSSSYVLGGVVSYANAVKTGVLGVPAALIDQFGAVSEPVAGAMAEGVRGLTGADIAVSTSGIAGPGGGVPGKPVGTVCFGLAIAGRETLTCTRRFPGDRDFVRNLATSFALHWVYGTLGD